MKDLKKGMTFSGFVQFPDETAREQFIHTTLDEDAYLKKRAFLPESRPTIIFERLTTAQRKRVRSAIKGVGKWFDDAQFRTMG